MTIQDGPAILPKGEFAKLINVSAGRVTQYITEGKLHGPALKGEGRGAKIVVDIGLRQLRRNLDDGQMSGNGLDTRLGPVMQPVPVVAQAPRPAPTDEDLTGGAGDMLSDQIKVEKLKEIRGKNRRQEEEERQRRGIYTPTADVVRALQRLADGMMQDFDGILNEMAAEAVAHPGIQHRDLLHLFRTLARKIRARAEEDLKRQATELAPTTDDPVESEAA